ncbi:MAG: hypothetical protein AAFV26_04135 [Pseudomonadota bacterium]
MRRTVIALAVSAAAVAMAAAPSALAGPAAPMIETAKSQIVQVGSRKYRKYRRRGGPQVRGFRQRRGGYSYAPQDTINTYGDSRSLFGSNNAFRDPSLDTQTPAGPFDHGFFFDSGNTPNGGNSPYFN